MRKKWKLLLACALSLALAVPASAARGGSFAAGSPAVTEDGQEEFPGKNKWLFRLEEPGSSVMLMSVDDSVEAISVGQGLYAAETLEDVYRFAGSAGVAAVQPNRVVHLLDMPDDPKYRDGTQWDRAVMGADEAWELGVTGAGVRIGVVDSGVLAEHEDLQGARILSGYDFVEEDDLPQDTLGHGTFVTGVIAAQANNGVGVAGIAPDAEIVPLKCFSERDSTLDVVLSAMYAAVDDYHCDIMNLSLGSDEEDEMFLDAVQYADRHGVLVVTAVGNDGKLIYDSDPLNWPAAYEETIGVGAVTKSLSLASFSQKNESVWVTAPGSAVYGLCHDDATGYRVGSGTSYATPCVTALLALAMEIRPGMTRTEAMELLKDTAVDLGAEGWDNKFGWGLVSVSGVLKKLWEAPPAVTASREDGGVRVTAAYETGLPPQACLLAAAYDEAGCMVELARGERIPAEERELALTASFLFAEENISRVKVMAVKEKSITPIFPFGAGEIETVEEEQE